MLQGVRVNALNGDGWYAHPQLYGTVAGKLDKAFQVIANEMMGYDLNSGPRDREWVRDNLRVPFLDWLFREAWPARGEITSSRQLTAGECHAILKFLALPEAQAVLEQWVLRETEVEFWTGSN